MAAAVNRHGGDARSVAADLGLPLAQIADFSASINPLGPPPGVLEAAQEALEESIHYPEIWADSLRLVLAEHHGLPEACLLPGAGSTELLYLFPQVFRPRRALLLEPAFSEYRRALQQVDCSIDSLVLSPGAPFSPQALLDRLQADTDLILLANPGNPTGAGIARQELLDLADQLPAGVALAVDEAFVDFCPELSLINLAGQRENLYLFRSLTKFYAIPGLRAGYLAGPPAGIVRLAEARQPWSLSTPALAAAIASLQADDYRQKTVESIPLLRRDLADRLNQLGLEVFPSRANYLLCRLPGSWNAIDLVARLRIEGLLLRSCTDFAGLDESYLRLAVRSAEENQRLLAALGNTFSRGDA